MAVTSANTFTLSGRRPAATSAWRQPRDPRCDHRSRRPGHEDAFGMARGERLTCRGTARLIQHRRPLWGRRGQMQRLHRDVLALVADHMHAVGIGVEAARAVGEHRAILPALLPQLVDRRHVVLGNRVAVVMAALTSLAHGAGGAVQIAGDDVPADPPVGQVIERREPPRHEVGRFITERHRHAEAEIARHGGHGGHEEQRVVRRQLRSPRNRRPRVAAVHIIRSEHVRQKHAVEQPALQQTRQIEPQRQPVELRRPVARMTPQPGRLMNERVHHEGIQQDRLCHEISNSDPGMNGRRRAVQLVVADREILPPHRIMQRMHPRVAPMPVVIVLRQGRAGAG